jgi:dihydrofolate reductase
MRRLVVSEFLSLDGVMQAPGGPDEDTDGGFAYGGWQMPYFDDVAGAAVDEGMARSDALLLGRKTYEIFAAYWPTAPNDDPLAAKINSMAKYVVSTTLDKVDWQNSTLIKGDIAEEIAKLKQQPGADIQVIGSGELAQTLIRRGLVDEYALMINPIVLGSGKRLFGQTDQPTRLTLEDSKTTRTGVLILTYRPADKPEVSPGAAGEVLRITREAQPMLSARRTGRESGTR